MDFTSNKQMENPERIENQNDAGTIEDEEHIKPTQDLTKKKRMRVLDYLKTSVLPSTSSILKNETIKIGKSVFVRNGNILVPKEKYVAGKIIIVGKQCRPIYVWNTVPPLPQQNISLQKMAPYMSGPIGAAREIETELEAFEIYITDDMLQKIITHTNVEIKIAQNYIFPSPSFGNPLSITELKAFIGILFLSAVKKDNKIPTSFLWDVWGSDIYSAVMSKERFEFIRRCLRFNDYILSESRRNLDSFFDIREIWDDFITKCSEVFRPSTNCTIDHFFIEFNGACHFKSSVPLQPQKQGIKLILLCDSKNRYIMSALPYLDKNKNEPIPLSEYMVENLTRSIRGTNINITYGTDWFTSVNLSKKMLNLYKITTLGILHTYHQEIPSDIILKENRPLGSYIFLYNTEDQLQLCSYYRANGEVNVILSSKYFDSVLKNQSSKPKIMTYYETTKKGVDAVKNMCERYSCSRQTKYWFTAIFYTILDLAGINSHTNYNLNRSRSGKPNQQRGSFLYKLALGLMQPHLKERSTDPTTCDSIRNKINCVIDEYNKLCIEKKPPKYTLQQIKDMYPARKNEKPTVPDSKSTLELTKLTVQQIQDMYPPVYYDHFVTPVAPERKPTKLTVRQVQDMYPPIYNSLNNNNIRPNLYENINYFQALYPPAPSYNSLMTAQLYRCVSLQQRQALFITSQTIQSVVPGINTNWNPPNLPDSVSKMQRTQAAANDLPSSSHFSNATSSISVHSSIINWEHNPLSQISEAAQSEPGHGT